LLKSIVAVVTHIHEHAKGRKRDIDSFWEEATDACEYLDMDYAEMRLTNGLNANGQATFTMDTDEGNRGDTERLYDPKRLYMRFPIEKNGKHLGVFICTHPPCLVAGSPASPSVPQNSPAMNSSAL